MGEIIRCDICGGDAERCDCAGWACYVVELREERDALKELREAVGQHKQAVFAYASSETDANWRKVVDTQIEVFRVYDLQGGQR